MRSAADFSPSNIAEGYGRLSDLHFGNFWEMPVGRFMNCKRKLNWQWICRYLSKVKGNEINGVQGSEVARLIEWAVEVVEHKGLRRDEHR